MQWICPKCRMNSQHLITKALVILVHGLETKFDAEMAAMTWVPWGTLESVGDQSESVNGINMILTSSIPVLSSLLSPIYFQFFLDKLASCLGYFQVQTNIRNRSSADVVGYYPGCKDNSSRDSLSCKTDIRSS